MIFVDHCFGKLILQRLLIIFFKITNGNSIDEAYAEFIKWPWWIIYGDMKISKTSDTQHVDGYYGG